MFYFLKATLINALFMVIPHNIEISLLPNMKDAIELEDTKYFHIFAFTFAEDKDESKRYLKYYMHKYDLEAILKGGKIKRSKILKSFNKFFNLSGLEDEDII